jgi:hypothetical protein
MPIDPNSIAPGKSYVTVRRHLRTVLELTNERLRYAYGGGDAGDTGQWRWQTKAKFANDAVRETSSDEGLMQTPQRTEIATHELAKPSGSNGVKPSGSRKILKKRQ